MKGSEKALLVSSVNDELKYLREEFGRNQLWGSAPDGDVKFEQIIDWLQKDDMYYNVEHLIKVIKKLEELK